MKENPLKKILNNVDGRSVRISALRLARIMESTPPKSRPSRSAIKQAYYDLYFLLKNPPEGYEIREVFGSTFTVEVRKIESN